MSQKKIVKSVRIGAHAAVESASVWSLAQVEQFRVNTVSVIQIPVQKEITDYLVVVQSTVYHSVTEHVSVNQAGKWTLQEHATALLMNQPAMLPIN